MANTGENCVAIIGGGAAGLAAAIACAGEARRLGKRVTVRVFEADDRVGRSILATGNGRCNFSNAYLSPAAYWNAQEVAHVLDALERVAFWASQDALGGTELGGSFDKTAPAKNAVLAFFAKLGLVWRQEGEGRLFPATGKASTVLDVLRHACAALGVRECCGMTVRSVLPPGPKCSRYTLAMADGAFERADAVICAVGGKVARDMLPTSFPFEPLRPVLGPLKTDAESVRGLDNIRVRCQATLELSRCERVVEQGEVLFRKYGISGIATFNLSRYAQPGDTLVLHLLPSLGDQQALAETLKARVASCRSFSNEPVTCEDALRGMLLPLVAETVCRKAGVSLDDAATDQACAALARAIAHFALQVEGPGDVRQCQVHRGGFSLEAFNLDTMESREFARLYGAGEMLDVDGPCGGFNLHWAWGSGLLAGVSAARSLAG